MKLLTAATLATIMSLGATVELDTEDDLHPDLYDIQEEADDFEEAINSLDYIWDLAEAQIRWWETVPVAWANFVGTWTNTWG